MGPWTPPRTNSPWESDAQIRKTLWEPLCKRAGVRYRNPYQVRHTYASTLLTAVYVACLAETPRCGDELYRVAHELVQAKPHACIAW